LTIDFWHFDGLSPYQMVLSAKSCKTVIGLTRCIREAAVAVDEILRGLGASQRPDE
jgi:hypothetical protein